MPTINNTINHGVTFGAPGYYSPLTVTSTGAINNHGTGQAIFGGTGTVVNDGHITATSGTVTVAGIPTVSTYSGVYLSDAGSFVDNSGTITASRYAAQLTAGGSVTNSGVLYGGRWGVTSRGPISVTNIGTIIGGSQGIVLSGGGFVGNDGLISGADGVGIGGGAGTVNNAGTIVSYGAGVALSAGGVVSNAATGLISVTGFYASVYITGGAGSVINAGTLSGYTGVSFVGTYNDTLIDTGTIIGTGGTAVAFGGGSDLLQFQPSASVFVQGTVDGGGGTLEFTSGATTGTLTGNNASFINFASGTVDAGASWVLAGNVTFASDITLANNSGLTLAASGTLVNAGRITGDLNGNSIRGGGTAALLDNLGSIQAYNIAVSLERGGTVINGASGDITALISANYGVYAASGLVSNYGTISASGTGSESVLLGGTGQVSNHAGGLITGQNIGVDLSGGVATLTNLGVVSGANNGALALYDGDVLMNGTGALIAGERAVVMAAAVTTPVSETLKNYGTITGQYGVIAGIIPTGGTLHATIVDAGTIIGTGGTAIADFAISASASIDLTLRLLVGNEFIQGAVFGEANGTGVLDFVSGSGSGTLTGAGADFINFQTASVDTGANWTFAGSNTLGPNTTLVDAGTLTNTGTLVVDPPIMVTGTFVNTGTLSLVAGSYVVQIAPGGYFLNTTAGLVARPNGGGTYAPAIYGETGGTSRVVNLGTISSNRFDAGVKLNAGGTVVNGAANATSALIYGGFPVLIQGASGTVTNYGTLRAVPTFDGSGVVLSAGGVVNNGIGGSTAALIAGDYNGVKLDGGGAVNNFGTISGHRGIYASNTAATVMNAGTIIGSAGFGVVLDAGGTVTDAGSISGSTGAVAFNSTSAGLLILEHGYSLHGVLGSGSASATVELLGTSAGNAVIATYNSLGLTNVGTIAFAPTSTNYATLQISNTATLPQTIANFTGAHDTIDLTTLAFVSGSSSARFNTASDQITVSNGTNSVTLQIGSGSYIGFGVVSDGAAGTDITVGPAALTYAWIGPSADWQTATDWSSGIIPGVSASATIANAGSNVVTIGSTESIQVANLTLSNSNTLDVAGTLSPTGTISIAGAVLSVSAGGLITSGSSGTLISGTGVVSNDGTIAGGNRNGISLVGTVLNQGSINATVNATTIFNRGTISNTTALATGVVGTGGSYTEVINGASGATGALIEGANTGVNLNGGGSGGTVVNYGTVIGENFLGVDLFASGGTVGLSNYGTILAGGSGLAYAAVHVASAAIINNSGVIEETAADTAGVYVRSNPGVTNIGLILNNSGLIAAAGHAVEVNSQIPAVVTNSGTLTGSEGFSVFYTAITNQTLIDSGTIIGTGGTAVAFGSGNDLLQFQPSTSAFVQGTVDGAGGTNTLEFASGSGIGTLTGSNADFVNFGNATIDAGASWVLAGSDTLGTGVTLTDSGALTVAGTLTNAGSLAVDSPITVTGTFINSSIVSALGGSDAVRIANGGMVTNTAGGTITGGTIAVTAAGTATIDNFGIIQATSYFAAVAIASGTVINGGAGNTAAAILGSSYGIQATGFATVVNYGTVTANHQEGVGLRAGGILDNFGVIAANEYGVFLYGPGTATNSGTITGLGGIVTNYAADVVVNSGDIAGTRGGGIILQSGGTVIDSGTISGSYFAVLFRGTVSNLLVLENGYKITGPIGGSASASSNVVELLGTSAANAVTANYNGLDLTRFGTIAFASGAGNYATLKITNDATLPGTITNFTGAHDTIDLTALNDSGNNASASFNSAADQLTISAGGSSVTLQLGSGNYSNVAWTVLNDGSNGTDIHPVTAQPDISGTVAGQATTDEAAIDPLAGVSIGDAAAGQTETVVVTMSNAANGTLQNLDGGSFNDGTYIVTGTTLGVTDALDGLAFQPTAHEVAPGDTVTTGFTIQVTDSNGASAGDSTTTVIATAVNDPPTVTHAVVDLGVPNETTSTPFSGMTVTDPDIGHTDTLTVTLSSAAGGGLSGFSSGSFDAGTGVYTVIGTDSQVTTALDSLVFTPSPPAAGYVATTGFTVAVTGPGGSDSDSTLHVTAVTQVLGLAATPAGDDVISVSPDGSGFATATADRTNQAVVRDPSGGGSYVLPDGYQAEFLGGSVNASLSDAAVGNVVLVGNTGNDTLSATAANDTILGGGGTNLIFGGNGALLLSNGRNDTIAAQAGSATVQASGADPLVFGNFTSIAGALNVSLGGAQATVTAGNSTAAITTGGSGALVFGDFGSVAAGMSLVDTGGSNTVSAGYSDVSATLAGSGALVFGGFGSAAGGLNVTDRGTGDTISTGNSDLSATLAGSGALVFGGFGGAAGGLKVADDGSGDTISTGNSAATITAGQGVLVFGGAGTLDFAGGSGPATVVAGSGAATLTGGSGGTTLYGGAGGAVMLSGGNSVLYVAGSGNETLNAGAGSGGDQLYGGTDAGGADSIVGGSGNDTMFAGAGADTLAGGGGANAFVFLSSLTHGTAVVVADFTASDEVLLSGYGAGDAATALGNAVSSGGSTTITLSDNTRITFLGVGAVGTLQGHVFSG